MTALQLFTGRRKKQASKIRALVAEPLEPRCLLSFSQGWDGAGLGGAELTYTIGQGPASLSQQAVESAIERAFKAWSNVADLSFTPTNQVGLPDSIDITFVNIDGPGGTLAQAYFPDDVNPARIAGDIQFDISEAWEIGNSMGSRAFDLVWVAVHEIGHALGLDHQHGAESVLRPSVSANQQFAGLNASDRAAIGELYAAKIEMPSDKLDGEPVSDPSHAGHNSLPNQDDQQTMRPRQGQRWRWHFWVHWSWRVEADTPTRSTPYVTEHNARYDLEAQLITAHAFDRLELPDSLNPRDQYDDRRLGSLDELAGRRDADTTFLQREQNALPREDEMLVWTELDLDLAWNDWEDLTAWHLETAYLFEAGLPLPIARRNP